jgi:predicted ArsR family transcriptional regulator
MPVNQWIRRLLSGTRGRIVADLRRGPATISELSERLELSANAVRSQLAALERDHLITAETAAPSSVGKPPLLYRLTEQVHSLTPKAYDAMLDVVLTAARERVGPQRYGQILRDTAARLAGDKPAEGTFETRLANTRTLLAGLGPTVEVERVGNKLRMLGTDCPLSSVVGTHPELCAVLAEVIGKRLGVAVAHCCDRSSALPRCCFEAVLERTERRA